MKASTENELAFWFTWVALGSMIVSMKCEGKIGFYIHRYAKLMPYDPDSPEVAARIADLIKAELPSVVIEHIGSTAVPNCDGKGIIDLMVLYRKGHLESTKERLDSLGFQPQPHKDPFPKERPMLVGSITYNKKVFQIHLHVIWQGTEDAYQLVKFRDRLREDYRLMQEYVRCKKRIVQSGTTDSLEYCKAKKVFIENVLSCKSG